MIAVLLAHPIVTVAGFVGIVATIIIGCGWVLAAQELRP
jgi:hypothetical protein